MVFGPKFPWARIRHLRKAAMQPEHFKFNSFEEEEGHISQLIERMLEFLDLDNPPTPENLLELAPDELQEIGPQHLHTLHPVALDDGDLHEVTPSADMDFYNDLSPMSAPLSKAEADLYRVRLVTRDSAGPHEDQNGSANMSAWDEELPFDAMSRPIKVAVDFQLSTAAIVSPTFVEEAGGVRDICCNSSPSSSIPQSDPTAFCPSDCDEIIDARFPGSRTPTFISPSSSTESLPSISSASSLQSTFVTTVKAFQWVYPPFDIVDGISKSPGPAPWSDSMSNN